MLDSTQWMLVIGGVALVAIGLAFWFKVRTARARHEALKQRFGPEYDRAVADHGSVSGGEAELRAREQRVRQQEIRPLSAGDRQRFSADWTSIQARFVDEPSEAVQAADQLIKEVMLAQGYSRESIDKRDTDLAVEHAAVIDDFRAARSLAERNREGRANTEELRQAFVHYRALFADILEPPTTRAERNMQEVHA